MCVSGCAVGVGWGVVLCVWLFGCVGVLGVWGVWGCGGVRWMCVGVGVGVHVCVCVCVCVWCVILSIVYIH